jgi:hypothetical protein
MSQREKIFLVKAFGRFLLDVDGAPIEFARYKVAAKARDTYGRKGAQVYRMEEIGPYEGEEDQCPVGTAPFEAAEDAPILLEMEPIRVKFRICVMSPHYVVIQRRNARAGMEMVADLGTFNTKAEARRVAKEVDLKGYPPGSEVKIDKFE